MRTIEDFIRFFKAIPDENWRTGSYGRGGIHCAQGHLGAEGTTYPARCRRFKELMLRHLGISPVAINDGLSPRFQQHSPKARILAALNEIKTKTPTP